MLVGAHFLRGGAYLGTPGKDSENTKLRGTLLSTSWGPVGEGQWTKPRDPVLGQLWVDLFMPWAGSGDWQVTEVC